MKVSRNILVAVGIAVAAMAVASSRFVAFPSSRSAEVSAEVPAETATPAESSDASVAAPFHPELPALPAEAADTVKKS